MLEPLEPSHADEMVAVLDDPELHRYVGGRPATLPELRERYERQARGRSADGTQRWLNWIVRERDTGAAAGYVQATVVVASGVADVAWVVGRRFQGREYAGEAAGAMTAWLRAAGVATVTAHIDPEHAASQAVARAIGLAPTTVTVDGETRWESEHRRRRIRSMADPTQTDPDKYTVVFENERVRVLEYRDEPGQRTSPHDHPDSVMITLSSFDRRLVGASGESRDVELEAGSVRWLDAQTHSGENIGDRPTHVVFVELKEPPGTTSGGPPTLGPS